MTTNLFESSEWSGEFFFPDSYDSRFQGRLVYSPEGGVMLSYTLLDRDTFRDSPVLHGVLDSGDPCTLLGRLPFPANMAMRNGVTSRNWKAGFPFLAVGGFLGFQETVTEIDFTLTALQEFFYPAGFKDFIKYSADALFSVRVPFGVIDVGNAAQFTLLPREIEAMVYSHDPEALKKLSDAFERVGAEHPEAFFSVKKDIEYRLIAKFDSPHVIKDAYQQVLNISNLFSVLLYSPVYPESIQFRKTVGDTTTTLSLYPSMVVDPRTIDLCRATRSHFHMPITQGTIPLDEVVRCWFREPDRYSVLVSAMQGETGFRDQHSAHGDILLYATQLESISYSDGQKLRKYTHPLENFAGQRVQQCLLRAFALKDLESVGVAISDLRNEIAHVGRPRVWLARLGLSTLVKIGQCLQLIVLDNILKQLGVPDETRAKYQEAFCPQG